MRLTLACLLLIAICMTMAARGNKGNMEKDKKYVGTAIAAYNLARYVRWRRVRWGRWGEKRGLNGRPGRPEEILAEMFKALDENHDGFVDIDELKDDMATVLKGESRTPDELMDETDTNGDGNIDFIEFVNDIMPNNPYVNDIIPNNP